MRENIFTPFLTLLFTFDVLQTAIFEKSVAGPSLMRYD